MLTIIIWLGCRSSSGKTEKDEVERIGVEQTMEGFGYKYKGSASYPTGMQQRIYSLPSVCPHIQIRSSQWHPSTRNTT